MSVGVSSKIRSKTETIMVKSKNPIHPLFCMSVNIYGNIKSNSISVGVFWRFTCHLVSNRKIWIVNIDHVGDHVKVEWWSHGYERT